MVAKRFELMSEATRYKAIVDQVTGIFRAKHSFSRDIAVRAEKMFGDGWILDFGQAVDTVFDAEDELANAIKGYAAFAIDALRKQKKFEVERKYESISYAEVREKVYFNEKYMMEQYLPGLLLSHYLWPHHYRQLKYFQNFFVSSMKRAGAEFFAEIGVGTGLYSRILLQGVPGLSGVGFDISEHSKAFAEDHVRAFGLDDRYQVCLQDVVANLPETSFQWLICVEVLEHLEDPIEFLCALRKMMPEGGKAFITAALNAPNEDHIYLYENAGQVLGQLQQANFVLEQYFFGAAHAPTAAGLPVPAVAAFIVS